jgi:hypothetical protein
MRKPLATFALLAFALAGCSASGDPTFPASGSLAASYITTVPASAGAPSFGSFLVTTTANGVTTDRVVTGAEIRLVLAADGSTSGHLFVPADGGGTANFDADLAGTWSATGDVVTLRHAADTFLRDMPLAVRDGSLVGDSTFGNVRVRLTLVRL